MSHHSTDKSTDALHLFLQEHIGPLQGIIRSYVIRAGLAQGEDLQDVMLEVLNDTTIEAFAHHKDFHTIRQPRAWFLGIAANVIKRRRVSHFRNSQHERPMSDLFLSTEQDSEADFFDHISRVTQPGPEQEIETRAEVAELLSLASSEDRRVLRLAFLQDLDTHHLALALKVTPGAARVRLYRALNRLRVACRARHQHPQERGHHA